MYICICTYNYIPKYNLLSRYTVIHMHISTVDNLVLGNQLVCSSLVEATSATPNFPKLPIALCMALRSRGLFPTWFDMFIGIILAQHTFGQSRW